MMLLFRYWLRDLKVPLKYRKVPQKYIESTSNFAALQVLASKAWAGEGARLPLQDHDLRAQPPHQQLLTTAARDHCLEPSITRVRSCPLNCCLSENDT